MSDRPSHAAIKACCPCSCCYRRHLLVSFQCSQTPRKHPASNAKPRLVTCRGRCQCIMPQKHGQACSLLQGRFMSAVTGFTQNCQHNMLQNCWVLSPLLCRLSLAVLGRTGFIILAKSLCVRIRPAVLAHCHQSLHLLHCKLWEQRASMYAMPRHLHSGIPWQKHDTVVVSGMMYLAWHILVSCAGTMSGWPACWYETSTLSRHKLGNALTSVNLSMPSASLHLRQKTCLKTALPKSSAEREMQFWLQLSSIEHCDQNALAYNHLWSGYALTSAGIEQ